MYDQFPPFQRLEKQSFSFNPSRYETWMAGKIISAGRVSGVIHSEVVFVGSHEKVRIRFRDKKLNGDLAYESFFDEFFTSKDRLQLITIPEITDNETVAIQMFKMTIGATCSAKNFEKNEPFCCNLFLRKQVIEKVTFSYSSPEKLLEFYI